MKPNRTEQGLYLLLLIGALFLRLPHFTPLALIGSDGSEYVYCVQQKVFPHSPYILHMWAGYLLDPWVSLDWGYSALSMVCSLASILFFGGAIRGLTGSFAAGWTGALVLTLVPVSIRFAGFQEVYSYQFLWLSLAWYLILRRRAYYAAGAALGAALATHTGTIFAVPATLLLILHSHSRPLSGRAPWISLAKVLAGMSIPVVAAFGWLWMIWVRESGQPLSLLPVYLRGAAPSPNLASLFGPQAGDYLEEQILRTWQALSDIEVIGPALLSGGFLSLLVVPPRKSLPWLLLAFPYLLYELAMGYSLDPGIYLLFVAPSVAVGVAFLVKALIDWTPRGWGFIPLLPLLAILLGTGITLVRFQQTAETRKVLPWLQPESSTLSLCRFVRDYSPPDTLLIQPVDWDPTGLASTLYSERTPLFNDGEILLAEPWKPLFTHPVFKHVRSVKTEDFDRWLDEGRPILSFDSDPFTSWGCYWPFVDIEKFETRPVLWLDRNQSGTSHLVSGGFQLASVMPGDERESSSFAMRYPPGAGHAEITLPVFRPTLYRLARKTDPPDLPAWARELQSHVPPSQWGAPPEQTLKGIGFQSEDGFLEMTLPTLPGHDHALRLTLNAYGADYIVECRVRVGNRWKTAGRDMEKIVVEPTRQFTDLYFRIPADWVHSDSIRVRLLPVLGTQWMSAYRVSVFVLPQG